MLFNEDQTIGRYQIKWDGKDEKIYSLEELGLGNQDGDVRTVMEDGYEFTEVYNQK